MRASHLSFPVFAVTQAALLRIRKLLDKIALTYFCNEKFTTLNMVEIAPSILVFTTVPLDNLMSHNSAASMHENFEILIHLHILVTAQEFNTNIFTVFISTKETVVFVHCRYLLLSETCCLQYMRLFLYNTSFWKPHHG